MVEWNHAVQGKPVPTVRTPDNITGFAQLERIIASSARPFILMGERELSVLRRGLTKDGWKRALYLRPAPAMPMPCQGEGLLSVANHWLDTDIDIPERSGDCSFLFCECGSPLQLADAWNTSSSYTCPACSRVHEGEPYEGAVRWLQHNQLAGAALACAIVYCIEKDKIYADKVAEILLKYVDAYPGPHTDSVTGGILHRSLCEAMWAIPLAQAYDLTYYSRSLMDREKQQVEQVLLKRIADGLVTVGANANWGSCQLSAAGVIGLTIKDAALVKQAIDAFGHQIVEHLGSDGLWPESVHAHHFQSLTAFVHFAESCYRAGIDLYDWEVAPGKSLKSMFLAPLQYMYPSFRLPAINDGWFDAFLPLSLYEIAHRRWSDPSFLWVLKKGYRCSEVPDSSEQTRNAHAFLRNSFYSFLFGRDLPGRSGTPTFRSQDFSDYGLCTLRNGDDLMVTFDYGPLVNHGHLDKFGFTLYANNALLVPDYGSPAYGPVDDDWFRSTPAHNTIVVDGESQEAFGCSNLTGKYFGLFLQFAEAQAPDIYPGVTHTRRIALLGGVCIINDELQSNDEHTYDWLMRCEGEPQVMNSDLALADPIDDYPTVKMDQARLWNDSCQVMWKCETCYLALFLWSSAGHGHCALGQCPAESMNRSVSFFTNRQRSKSARFTAALVPSQSDKELELSGNESLLRIVDGYHEDYLYMRCNGAEGQTGPMETDAEMAMVRLLDGNVVAVALVKGSWIRWNGDVLIDCPEAACVEVSFEERNPVVIYTGDTPGIIKLKTNARAIRINGQRSAATAADGHVLLRVTSQMLNSNDVKAYI